MNRVGISSFVESDPELANPLSQHCDRVFLFDPLLSEEPATVKAGAEDPVIRVVKAISLIPYPIPRPQLVNLFCLRTWRAHGHSVALRDQTLQPCTGQGWSGVAAALNLASLALVNWEEGLGAANAADPPASEGSVIGARPVFNAPPKYASGDPSDDIFTARKVQVNAPVVRGPAKSAGRSGGDAD